MDRRARSSITLLLALLASLVLAVAPAWAHHKDGHDNGGGQGSQQASDDDDGIPDDYDDNEHPSGKDRETNDGSTDDVQGGDQTSNPDNDGHGPERNSCKGTSEDRVGGCADKPGGTGGVDQDDQDWNNGCGNDDDFEDDNEGWCGKPPDQVQSTQQSHEKTCPEIMGSKKACEDDDVLGSQEKTCPEIMGSKEACDDDVLGGVIRREANPKNDAVLGVRFGAGSAPAAPAVAAEMVAAPGEVLPFTDAGLVPFVAFGLGLIGVGSALLVRKSA